VAAAAVAFPASSVTMHAVFSIEVSGKARGSAMLVTRPCKLRNPTDAFGFAEVRGGEETSLVVRVLNDAARVVATRDGHVGRMTDVVMLKPRARGSVSLGWSEPLLMDLRTRGLRNKSRFS
jgi:hypothetical protein